MRAMNINVMAGTKLELHKMQAHRNPFKLAKFCDPCGFMLRSRGIMELHVSQVHKGQSTKCRLCGKGVRIRAKLKNLEVRVVRRVGTKVLVMERLTTGAERKEDLKCDLCGVDDCELANLKQHEGGWCGLNLHKCDPCGIWLNPGRL